MNLIGSGRSADVYDGGDGLVIRRYKTQGDSLYEAAVMQHVRAHGFPAPEVAWVSGREMAMELVDGPTMLADLGRRPWRIAQHARTLADLHKQLAAIPAAAWMAAKMGGGAATVHLDLHPDNVLLAPGGPVVIDWPNAGAGRPGMDVAQTWVILASARIPVRGPRGRMLATFRRLFVRLFLDHAGRATARAELRTSIGYRLQDRNLLDDERATLRRMLETS